MHLTEEATPRRVNSKDASVIFGIDRHVLVRRAGQGRVPGAARIGTTWTFDVARLQEEGFRDKPQKRADQEINTVNEEWILSEMAKPRDRVYLVGFGKYVKIGYSGAKKTRRYFSLQTGAPEKMEVYGEIKGGRALEGYLHRKFAAYRLEGEWFYKRGALAKWIAEGCYPPERYISERSAQRLAQRQRSGKGKRI